MQYPKYKVSNIHNNSHSSDEDYRLILEKYNLNYKYVDPYLVVDLNKSYDTIVYISVIQSEIWRLLEILVPEFVNWDLSFGIVKSKKSARRMLDGRFGYDRIGKVIMVFLTTINNSNEIINNLICLTKPFRGPEIPDGTFIGGLLYLSTLNNTTSSKDHITSKTKMFLNNKYAVLKNMKPEPRGSVFLALYFKNLLTLRRVIIKEGKRSMFSDTVGRDMKDRLEWQKKVHVDLYNKLNVPLIIELFEENHDSFLVMEYIKGQTLRQAVTNVYKGRSWKFLNKDEKVFLVNLLTEVINSIDKIHCNGYVHRDLTPSNFLISQKKGLYIIDWELTYGLNQEYPFPPFRMGTPGFVAPEQIMELQTPTTKEDIYALGALMIVFFTNLWPVKFNVKNPVHFKESLNFFIDDLELVEMITKCLSDFPSVRPNLRVVKSCILSLAKQNVTRNHANYSDPITNRSQVSDFVKSICCEFFKNKRYNNFALFYLPGELDPRINNENRNVCGLGLLHPIHGLVILLYLINSNDPIVKDISSFKEYLSSQGDDFFKTYEISNVGLFFGLAGKALTMHFGILAGIISNSSANNEIIESCFSEKANTPDLAEGVAGMALAALIIFKRNASTVFKAKADGYINILTSSQKSNGSWNINFNNNRQIPKGLGYGISGIIVTLIKYDQQFPDNINKAIIKKALRWLTCHIDSKEKIDLPDDIDQDQSLLTGRAGVTLAFLYAYEHFGEIEFKSSAERILQNLIDWHIQSDYSLLTGLTGLGMVYLEAARICDDPKWEKQAMRIYEILIKTSTSSDENKITWNYCSVINKSDEGLLTGTSGIMLFLFKIIEHLDYQN